MDLPELSRGLIQFSPLSSRESLVSIEETKTYLDDPPPSLPLPVHEAVDRSVRAVKKARENHRPVMMTFGAHAIKNGLSPLLIRMMEEGWVTHLATNGAGIIHDWEFAYQGKSSEDVRRYLATGQFGAWEETGFYLNVSLCVGAYRGYGYGESVGALVQHGGIEIPSTADLQSTARDLMVSDPEKAASALDLLGLITELDLESGFHRVDHPYAIYGLQAAAFRLGIPYTAHPMFGHDIIYIHPACRGSAVGRTADRDFLRFAASVKDLQHGVYLSVGSAVMSPMVFEKSLSMARNLAYQNGCALDDFSIFAVDLEPADWDWASDGEPPTSHPAYYRRYMKTFHRTGARTEYICADNRVYLPALYHGLKNHDKT